jgi:outer membrane protein assembly factor BamB
MKADDPHYIDHYNLLEPWRSPLVVGEWDFVLSGTHQEQTGMNTGLTVTSDSQFFGVSIYGATDIHDASDKNFSPYNPSNDNKIDSEAYYQLNSISEANLTLSSKTLPECFLTANAEPTCISTIPAVFIIPPAAVDEYNNALLEALQVIPVSVGLQYRFDYWTVDDIAVEGNPISVHIDANHTATAHYLLQGRTGYDWPMFHQNPTRTGHSPSNAPQTNNVLWSYDARSPGSKTRDSSPAVADGLVFIGAADHRVYALNETNGRQVWNYTTGSLVGSSPAVADGLVFIGSADHRVYALNETTGSQVWNYMTGGNVLSSPVVADGLVFVGSFDRRVYALNETNGGHVWNYTTDDLVWSSPAVADGLVFIGSDDSRVYCLNETTGNQVWNYTTGSWVGSSPAVADGLVYVGSLDWNVYCLNASTGAKVWNYTTGDYVEPSPAVADGMVFAYSKANVLFAFGILNVDNIAVTDISPSKSVVCQGYSCTVNVTVSNKGEFTETFNITAYANATFVAMQEATLSRGQSATITFEWNTSGLAKGNYSVSALAHLASDADPIDNNLVDGWIIVSMVGDITGPTGWPDGKVDARDVAKACSLYGVKIPDPKYNPNWDLTGPALGLPDGKIDARDVSLIASRYGQKDP